MILTAYYGLLRIGEVARGDHMILAKDVHIATNKNKILFLLRSSKTHCASDNLQSIKITSTKQTSWVGTCVDTELICPYALLREYLRIRPKYVNDVEPFFILRDRSPVPPVTIAKILRLALVRGGFTAANYTFRSLRSGRAVDLLHHGISVETIKKLGKWRSNAVFRYLKQ